jgi:hypothetical protein
MEFESLADSINSFLDSIIPALGQSMLFVAFLGYVLGVERLRNFIRIFVLAVKRLDEVANSSFVKESGILKLVPVVILIGGLISAMAFDRAVQFIGRTLPGRLFYSQPAVLFETVPLNALAQLWSIFPSAGDAHMLHQVVDQQVSLIDAPKDPNHLLPWISHERKFSYWNGVMASAKFYVLVTLVLIIFHRRTGVSFRKIFIRTVVILVFCSLIISFSIFEQMEAKKQSEWSKVNYLIAARARSDKGFEVRIEDKKIQEIYIERVRSHKETGRKSHESAFYSSW